MTKDRVAKIREIIKKENASAFLIVNHEYSGQPGTHYLSGFSGSESILVITETEETIFTDGRYFAQIKEECANCTLVPFERFSPIKQLVSFLGKSAPQKILLDSSRTTFDIVEQLKENLKGVDVKGVRNILQEIRITKEDEEVKAIQEATNIAATAFEKLLTQIKEGQTEIELACKLEALMREGGADKISFDTIVVSGVNGAKPHGKPSSKAIEKGELITFDFGCFKDGYASDTTRTIALGEPAPKLKEIYEVVKESQELGCQKARAGMTGGELDAICRNYIKEKGYGEYFLHSTGHGLGMEVHELPYVSGSHNAPLLENSVITIEPGIYIEGLGGVRIEDAVLLKKDGIQNLSHSLSKELIII